MLRPQQVQSPQPQPQIAAPIPVAQPQQTNFNPPAQPFAPKQPTQTLSQMINPNVVPTNPAPVAPQGPTTADLTNQILSMKHQLAMLQQTQSGQAAVPQTPAEPAKPVYDYLKQVDLSDDTKHIMKGPLLNAVQEVADAMFAQRMNETLQGINKQAAEYKELFDGVNNRMEDMGKKIFEGDITHLAPQFQTMRDHPDASKFLSQRDFSGKTYADILSTAEKSGDAQTVANITQAFTNSIAQQQSQENYTQMTQPVAEAMPGIQMRNPMQQYNPAAPQVPVQGAEYYQPPMGLGEQSRSYTPSMPQQHQGMVRMQDYSNKMSQLDAQMLQAQSEGRFDEAAQLSTQMENMGLAASDAYEMGTLIPT